MDYQATLDWMFAQLPMYQTIGASAYKEDLTNTILLTNYLGNPERNVKCIHVAGTNGKGSTSHMLASILAEAGYKTGLYTSPHLKDFRERIKIVSKTNLEEIPEQFVSEFINEHKLFFEKNQLSFFEMTVGLAFDFFEKEKVDIAIIEVGMGGRLDSTNIITPLISVITNIGLDHTQFLGTTLAAIAGEKAGIIKPSIPVIIGEYNDETKPVFIAKATLENASIYFASDLIKETYPSDLIGDYQIQNKKTVFQTIRILQTHKDFTISEVHIENGFRNTIKNTKLLGRWQQLQQNPKVICDTAHNKHGLEIVLKQIQKLQFDQLHFVFGVVNDKDLDEILPLFPKNAIYYFCKPNILRGLDATLLKEKCAEFNLEGAIFNSVSEAYHTALLAAKETDMVFIGGSTFVVAEIL
jgi:dihydrofolate synthase / folylpolyglutamate synthase